jgi:CheY-like chemotaxis protein
MALADPGRIRQIIAQLVTNAVKFTKRGHVLIDVTCTGSPEGVANLRVAVRDTGIGIPPEKAEHIFERFTQADSSNTRSFGGTGIGLAICRRLMNMMGGSVGVKSEVGVGSEFWMLLPLPFPFDPNAAPPTHPAAANRKVAVVGASDLAWQMLDEQLGAWGAQAVRAGSTAEAAALVADARVSGAPVHALLVDAFVSDAQARAELAQSLRRDMGDARPRLILIETPGNPAFGFTSEWALWDAILVKPLRNTLLLEALSGVTPEAAGSGDDSRASGTGPQAGLRGADRTTRTRVLLAEDNPVNQVVVVRMLEKMGCRVNVAANGREAVEMLSEIPFDMVFLDCQMPEMDGFQATAEIRRGKRARVPVVGLTAYAMEGERERCFAAGMDDYITKPVKARELGNALLRWLGGR